MRSKLIKDRQDAGQANIAGLLERLSGQFGGTLDKPFSLDNQAVEDSIVSRYGQRLGDQQARDRASTEANLIARGIRPGSAAYDSFQQSQGQKENDQWNQIYINARDQAVNEKLTERNQPLKEFSALLSGSQIDQPMFGQTPGASVAGTDYARMVQDNYTNKLEAWKAQTGRHRRAVRRRRRARRQYRVHRDAVGSTGENGHHAGGKTDDGQNIYSYKYKGGKHLHLGLMAQEVEKKTPEAVVTLPSGLKAVDYSKALHLGA
jgi:hypothetical protein